MNISPNNEKIEKYLDELAEEYKTLLYKSLVSRTNPLDDLSISELLRLDNEIKKPLHEDYQKFQKKRKQLIIIGLTYIMIGIILFLLFKILRTDFYYNIENIVAFISIIVIAMGVFAIFFSIAAPILGFVPNKYRQKSNSELKSSLEYEIIIKWRELEGLANDISIEKDISTPRSVISFLSENHFIDENDYNILRDYLKIRNSIAHNNENNFSIEEIKKMLDSINTIINKIKRIV